MRILSPFWKVLITFWSTCLNFSSMQRDKLFTASNAFGLLIGHLGIQARWNKRKVGWDPVNLITFIKKGKKIYNSYFSPKLYYDKQLFCKNWFRQALGMWHCGSQFSYLNQAFKIPFLPISHALQLIKWIPRIYCIY